MAVIAVHLLGRSGDISKVSGMLRIVEFLIEDCAESFGATYDGQLLGTFGDACFQFLPIR